METIVQGWLSIWLYVMVVIAVILCCLIYKNRKIWSKVNIFCTLTLIVLVLHVLEEWVFPGGLHYSYNIAHGSKLLSRYPMNRLTDMITNFGAVLIGCMILKIWGFNNPSALVVMLFCAMEVTMHIKIGVQDMLIFEKYGMNTIYSPGLVTSLFGFLPIGVLLAFQLFKDKEKQPKLIQWILAIVASIMLGFLLINLPEKVLRDENTPYEFTNRGYYEKYGESFEKDNEYYYFKMRK